MSTQKSLPKKKVKSVIYDEIPIQFAGNLVKIGPVDHEITFLEGLFHHNKKEINASRTYTPRGMHTARAK